MSHSFEWHPQHDALHRSRGVRAPRSPLNLCGTRMESTGNQQGIPDSAHESLLFWRHFEPPRNFPLDTRSSEERWVPNPGDFSLDTDRTQILGEVVESTTHAASGIQAGTRIDTLAVHQHHHLESKSSIANCTAWVSAAVHRTYMGHNKHTMRHCMSSAEYAVC